MLLWALGINATRVDFSVVGQSPYLGLVLSSQDGRLHDRTEFGDPAESLFPSTRRFPAPSQNVFWLFLDETFIPDGRYLVQATSNAVGALPVVYEIVIRGGIQVDFPGPPGFTPPPFCLVTGAEFGPDGAPLNGVKVTAYMESSKPSVATWGSVYGTSETVSDISGAWALPLAPTPLLMPQATYRIAKRHMEFGISQDLGIFVPASVGTRTLSSLIAESAIRKMEIFPAPAAVPAPPPAGYITVTGTVVDVTGRPMDSVPVTIGTGYWGTPAAAIPNAVGATAVAPLYAIESEFRTATTANKVLTVAAYPAAPITTVTIPIGSEIISVADGFGNTFGPPLVTYVPTTGVITFDAPFVGVVKYRTPSDGSFSVSVPMPGAYWIQVGITGERHPFTIHGGITTFDVGKAVFYPGACV
jgi:hypothetical protein